MSSPVNDIHINLFVDFQIQPTLTNILEDLHRVFHVKHFSEEQFAKNFLQSVKWVIKLVISALIAGMHLLHNIL